MEYERERKPQTIMTDAQIEYLKRLMENEVKWTWGSLKSDYNTLYKAIIQEFEKWNKENDKGIKEELRVSGGLAISENTVFRVWGYINDGTIVSDSSYLNFVILLGFKTILDFINYYDAHKADCDLFDPSSINVANLEPNTLITLGWIDVRHYMKVKYLGDFRFEVIDVVGQFKKKKGDMFEAKKFFLDYAYYISDKGIGYPCFPTICASMNEKSKSKFSGFL